MLSKTTRLIKNKLANKSIKNFVWALKYMSVYIDYLLLSTRNKDFQDLLL